MRQVITIVLFVLPMLAVSNVGNLIEAQKADNKPDSAKRSAPIETITVKGVSFNMRFVEGGTFLMGSSNGNDDEKPVHKVKLSDYYIGETEVTQALWVAVMGNNPSNWNDDNMPVESVTWKQCCAFVKELSRLTGRKFNLPTEAQWEFAARGGNKSQGYIYSGSNNVSEVAAHKFNTRRPLSVGQLKANELGIYDMSGNVWEWCLDYYGPYSSSPQTNPKGPTTEGRWVKRGGAFDRYEESCTCTHRNDGANWDCNTGFRIVMLP